MTSPSPAPLLPTETELYILPDGRVVVADLPAELMSLVTGLGKTEPCELMHPPLEEGSSEHDQPALPLDRTL